MNLQDKIVQAMKRGEKIPLEGKTKIILTDVNTGKEEIREKKNMVTNAMTRIFENNWLGITQFNGLLPMSQLFGGIMCFADPLIEDADNIFPPCESVNSMVANAGQTTTPDTTGTRGNPQTPEISGDTIKFIWNWPTTSGNGTISACALTSSTGGDVSLKPTTGQMWRTITPAITDINMFSGNQTADNTFTRNHSIALPIKINDSGLGVSVWISGTTFEEIVTSHPFNHATLLEPSAVWPAANYRVVATRTATLTRSFDLRYAMLGQDDTNYYVMERDSSSATTLHVNKINKSTMAVTAQDITVSGATLSRPSLNLANWLNGIVADGYIYCVSGADSKTFVKINMSNTADVTILNTNLTSAISLDQTPFVVSSGLILGRNYLVNGDTVYPVSARSTRNGERNETLGSDILARYGNSPSVYQGSHGNNNNTYTYHTYGCLIFNNYLGTIQNIDPVNKTASKTMRIEYSITAV